MPIRTQSDLPAKEILEQENIFVMDESRAMHQDIRPINIVILNLMPLKEETELQIFRSLSNTPLQVDVSLLAPASHASTHTSKSHLNKFYQTFQEIKNQYFDGLIITGAPVEQMKYEEVDYWDEVCEIMEWSKKHVTSTLHLCWGAQAALYYHYGIPKYDLEQKMFGVFRHHVMNRKIPMVRGFDDYFYAPHSRHTEVRREDVEGNPKLWVLSESEESGLYIVSTHKGRRIFVMGHSEYDPETLKNEYVRDVNKGLSIQPPRHYFPANDPSREPVVRWGCSANLLFSNWLNYYVYQETPYELQALAPVDDANV